MISLTENFHKLILVLSAKIYKVVNQSCSYSNQTHISPTFVDHQKNDYPVYYFFANTNYHLSTWIHSERNVFNLNIELNAPEVDVKIDMCASLRWSNSLHFPPMKVGRFFCTLDIGDFSQLK